MRFDVVTLFPGIFQGYLTQSLLHKAIEKNLVQVELHDLRDWAKDKHHSVDDRPFGGGPGMVLKVDTVVDSVERTAGQTQCDCLLQDDPMLIAFHNVDGFVQEILHIDGLV